MSSTTIEFRIRIKEPVICHLSLGKKDTVTQSLILSIHSSKFVDQTSICGGLRLDLLSESN